MKKNLRLLCLGLAAAAFTCSFAQDAQNMTDKLTNADMELGLQGWGFDGEKLMGKNTKNPSTQVGFYGMSQGVLEAWNGNLNGLADAYIMQRLGNLPSGTYVFGAYMAASKQTHRKQVKDAQGNAVAGKHEYWSNRDSINGVYIFANEAAVKVGTNNPDWNGMFSESHAEKFNVAVTLTDTAKKKGYMDVGVRYENTNANYVVWDNATLYFFGDMTEAEALDAMAKIDVDAAIAITDTLKNVHMNKDSLSTLTNVLAQAAAAEVTAANFNEVLNTIYWNAGLARKSATDYANLKKNIATAKVVAGGEWTSVQFVGLLNDAIAAAEAAYEAKAMNRAEITALRKELNWSAGDVKYDSVMIAQKYLADFIKEAKNLEGAPGGYTAIQIASLTALAEELQDTCNVYEKDAENEDFALRTVDPNGLYNYIARINTAIENVKKNPISAEYTQMPIVFNPGADKWVEGSEWYNEAQKVRSYTSPMYRFEGKIENFRITVKQNKNGAKFFCLSELEFYDAQGNLIPLTEDNISSNADHNALNGTPDGGGFAAMFDQNTNTYFHSAWQNMPSGDHYLEVTLPDGGYDAFSFKMFSRDNTNGHDQSHTFPGSMTLSTPMPKRDALEEALNEAKNLRAYSMPEPGFYNEDFSYVLEVIAEAEAFLNTNPSEAACVEMTTKVNTAIANFGAAESKSYRMPEAGKQYRIVSALPAFYEKQYVEKALTVHAADTTLWWEDVCADSLQQLFVFEPVLEEGEPFVKIESGENEDGTTWTEYYYCYTLQNVKTGLYVDSAFVNNQVNLVEQALDTVMLKPLGAGQWNIVIRGASFHCGDHNSGNFSTTAGAYGGTYGVSSGIVSWGGGLDGASAWYIREMPELPLTQLVSGGKSEFVHFDAANTVTLTADKDCAFADLALYDFFGNAIAVDTVVVAGNKATLSFENAIVGCSYTFSNTEGVASVVLDAYMFNPTIDKLQAAYDAAVALEPAEGEEVGLYADLTEYNAALEAAEAMLASGASDEEILAMVARVEAAVAGLTINLPVEGKYYFIYNGLAAFEKNHGFKVGLYTDYADLRWAHINDLDYNRYWQFEKATVAELKALEADSTAVAFYIKNVATGQYVGKADGMSQNLTMVDDHASTVPYSFTALQGSIIAIASVKDATHRLHGAGHGGGGNKAGAVCYWNSGLESSSSWCIVETQFDLTDIDFTEVENDEKVSAKGIYDLFGRRVINPTAAGIYIIDGKKRLVK